MPSSAIEIADRFAASLAHAARFDMPFRHFFAENLFPADVADDLTDLPITGPLVEGLSGRREYHNAARSFCNVETMQRFPVLAAVADALQSPPLVQAISALCGAVLENTFLRIEYAADGEGFWLEPHTDLGAKKFTCLIYLPNDDDQSGLGTDVYTKDKAVYKRVPFQRNAGLIFVPADDTWHGFAPRPMKGCRKSLILNYVGAEWLARDQLAFPDRPIRL